MVYWYMAISMSCSEVDGIPIRKLWSYSCDSCGTHGLVGQTTNVQEPIVLCSTCFDEDGVRKRLILRET